MQDCVRVLPLWVKVVVAITLLLFVCLDIKTAHEVKISSESVTKSFVSLRATIANQEKEITTLLAAIAEKDATITNQSNVIAIQKDSITIQYQTIKKQKEELKRTVLAQTEMLFLAGQGHASAAARAEVVHYKIGEL